MQRERLNQWDSQHHGNLGQIAHFLRYYKRNPKERYGDFVRYNPELDTKTWLLWFGPFVLLARGCGHRAGYQSTCPPCACCGDGIGR